MGESCIWCEIHGRLEPDTSRVGGWCPFSADGGQDLLRRERDREGVVNAGDHFRLEDAHVSNLLLD